MVAHESREPVALMRHPKRSSATCMSGKLDFGAIRADGMPLDNAVESGPCETVAEGCRRNAPAAFRGGRYIRAHGSSFVEKSRSWLTWLHLHTPWATG